ncbi:MAG: hypothetical protein PF517_00700 [Salinivirgaceae bacterium]|jgi:hypothetical protein|nr:hypothetical protein [Salinivirgaceae bacterium]
MQDGKTFLIGVVAILFFFISFKGCKDENNGQLQYQQNGNFEKSPVDVLIRDLNSEQNFNITLMDMDFSEETDKYKHKYNILVERPDSVYAKETAWLPVSAAFFNANMENMGMEIASKLDGKVSKNTAPAGYSNYIGNEKYGQWRERDGGSFWEFYGKYAFMSSMFRMAMFPVRHSYWNDYRGNYYGSGRSYYGPTSNGSRMYGTNSTYAKNNTNSKWNSKSSNFKSRVQNKVRRSAASKKRAATQRTRSSNRYSSSSTRSRGGSFGK